MNIVTVIGSINLDTTLRVQKMPKPGETIHAIEHFTAGGGKGANQAVAAKRLGAKTYFIGAVGNDAAGQMMTDLMSQDEIDLTAVKVLPKTSTGQAFITVDAAGENSITIFAGANQAFTSDDVLEFQAIIAHSDFIIAQLESSLDATITTFKLAKQAGVKTILNPAPALTDVPKELLQVTDMIIPNETETEILTGIRITNQESMQQAVAKLHALGIQAVIITMGSKGAFYDVAGQSGIVPALKVKAVDTTAAGDTFIGALSTVLNKDFSNLSQAIAYSNRASALTVQRFGAQPSIPYEHELND
ncbi:ribokinase [Ligilactobacillus sp. Marseille-Q7487]|jgi:ribokinase|uniref:ribokinase n=1 Tax=Ligilactobacillus sp. Marseille-Q7487 TaxID=3022128 RepID=UPI0015B5349A|nr:ribokinase [Ligilactobacillus sp. Marseille-Q7487]